MRTERLLSTMETKVAVARIGAGVMIQLQDGLDWLRLSGESDQRAGRGRRAQVKGRIGLIGLQANVVLADFTKRLADSAQKDINEIRRRFPEL